MNITTDVQTTEETKEKRYKTLFGSALGYMPEGLDIFALIFRTRLYFKRVSFKPC